MTEEHKLQNEILNYLNLQPDFFAWRNQSTGIYTGGVWRKKVGFDISGVSDILAIHYPSGKLVAIEVKRPGSTRSSVSKEQLAFIGKVNKMRGVGVWVQSLVEVESLVKTLRTCEEKNE